MEFDIFKRMLAPLQRRVMLMVARGIIKLSKDDIKIQTTQIDGLAGEIRDDVPRIQEYGFSSRPLDGAECVVLFLGGNRDNGVVIATDDGRYRFKNLQKGECALYTDEGDYIHLKRGKIIKIKAQTSIDIESPKMTLTGNLEVSGKITAQQEIQGLEVKNAAGTTIGGHKHPYTDTPVGPSVTSAATPGT